MEPRMNTDRHGSSISVSICVHPWFKKLWLTLPLVLLLTACGKPAVYSTPTAQPAAKTNHASRLGKLQDQYRAWRGVPHRDGGMSKKGVDCSGLVYLTFKEKFNTTLPRSTKGLSGHGKQISRRDLQPGDLVFFKITWKGRHVGIYTSNNTFIHTSKSKGVMTSRLDNPYWQKTYWQSRRVLR